MNCETQGRHCPYQDEDSTRSTPITTSNTDASAVHATISSVTEPSQNFSVDIQSDLPTSVVDLTYIELLQQWLTETHRTYAFTDEHAAIFRLTSLNHALAFPFLMHGILANAALHLSVKHPSKATTYLNVARELSNKALSEFSTLLPDLNQESIVAAFLFSTVIGGHHMCECFLEATGTFDSFLDRFVACLKIFRGVIIVIRGWWSYLQSSELKPILTIVDRLQAEQDIDQETPELDDLRQLIRSLEGINSATATATYLESTRQLQRYLNVQKTLDGPEFNSSSAWAFAWPTNASQELINMLEMRRPEALIILAYYTPLLHSRRSSWAIGTAGSTMFGLIESALGSMWTDRLQWPREFVSTE